MPTKTIELSTDQVTASPEFDRMEPVVPKALSIKLNRSFHDYLEDRVKAVREWGDVRVTPAIVAKWLCVMGATGYGPEHLIDLVAIAKVEAERYGHTGIGLHFESVAQRTCRAILKIEDAFGAKLNADQKQRCLEHMLRTAREHKDLGGTGQVFHVEEEELDKLYAPFCRPPVRGRRK